MLRSWQTPSKIDDDLTKKSRTHIALALYAHVVMTMVFYSGQLYAYTNHLRLPLALHALPPTHSPTLFQVGRSTTRAL